MGLGFLLGFICFFFPSLHVLISSFFNTEWSTSFLTKVLLEENNLTVSVPCPELNLNFKLGDLYKK